MTKKAPRRAQAGRPAGGAGKGPEQPSARLASLEELTPDPRNANKGTERGVGMLEQSLRKYGAGRSILVDKHGVIIAGNKTHERAVDLGLEGAIIVETDGTRLVVVKRTDLEAGDKAAAELGIADNRVAQVGLEWDPAVLEELVASGVSLDHLFTDKELVSFMASTTKGGNTDPDDVPPLRPTEINLGDLFELGAHRLLCGDSGSRSDVERMMAGSYASAVVTDSPYGIGKAGVMNDDQAGLRELFDRTLSTCPVKDGIFINFQSPRLFPIWVDAVRAHGHSFERALWFYDQTDVTFPWRGWLMTSQIALVSSLGSPAWPTDVPHHHDCYLVKTAGAQDDAGGHPTAKPVDIVENLISHTTGLLYEPFCGSGTTVVAAELADRSCYSVEIKPSYCQVIIDRWEAFTGKRAVKCGEAIRA